MEPQFKIGVNIILLKDNKVLLGKRLKKAGFGEYGLPGGHLEIDESFWEAGKRELFEETGLVAHSGKFIQVVNSPRGAGQDHYMHINFLVTEWEGEVENKEPNKCEGWEWFSLDSLPENIFYGHAKFFPALKENILFIDSK